MPAALKSMRRMRGMGRLRKMKDLRALKGGKLFEEGGEEEEFPDILALASIFDEEEDDALSLIHRRMGGRQEDQTLAQRVLGWMQSEIPNATIPEAIVYDYLKMTGRSFIYQHYVYGGRTARGGVVPDFLVEQGGEWMVWNVQGEYWHSQGINQGKDTALRYRLLGAIILGLRISAVVEMWENDLYNKRPAIWQLAWAGRGLRE